MLHVTVEKLLSVILREVGGEMLCMSNLRVVATRDITVSIALLPLGNFSIGLSGNLFSGNRLKDF